VKTENVKELLRLLGPAEDGCPGFCQEGENCGVCLTCKTDAAIARVRDDLARHDDELAAAAAYDRGAS